MKSHKLILDTNGLCSGFNLDLPKINVNRSNFNKVILKICVFKASADKVSEQNISWRYDGGYCIQNKG